MDEKTIDVLYEIFHETENGGYVTVNELEVTTGERGSIIRKHAEILKESGFLFEREQGLQVSEKGISFSRTRWV